LGASWRRWWEPSQERLVIGFDPELQAQVTGELAADARTVCNETMHQGELRYADLALSIARQPMCWNKAFMEDVLGFEPGVAFDSFEEYTSMNSCGLATSIHEARRTGRVKRGDTVLLFGPAARYTFGAIAGRW
jgi:3-oxoacyl-[acyl-carrier-protein] synthase III